MRLDDVPPEVAAVLSNRPWVILLIEDDPDEVAAVRAILQDRKSRDTIGPLRLMHAASLADARDIMAVRRFDLLIVDWRLPDGEGLDFLVKAKGKGKEAGLRTPAIMLTNNPRSDLERALVDAADDFISKADQDLELRPRVRALLRRDDGRTRLRYGALEISFADLSASYGEKRLNLTFLELNVLGYLAACEVRATAPGNNTSGIVTMGDLLEHVWLREPQPWRDGEMRVPHPDSKVVQVTISRLRGKLKAAAVPVRIDSAPAHMTIEAAAMLKLSPEDRERARELTTGWTFVPDAALSAVVKRRA